MLFIVTKRLVKLPTDAAAVNIKTRYTNFLELRKVLKVVDAVTPDVSLYLGLESRPLRNWSMHVT